MGTTVIIIPMTAADNGPVQWWGCLLISVASLVCLWVMGVLIKDIIGDLRKRSSR